MPNNENDLSDNVGKIYPRGQTPAVVMIDESPFIPGDANTNPHIGSDFNDFLESEGIREEVEQAAMAKIHQNQANRIHITISGPVGRGKTVIIDAIEKLLRDQMDAKNVFVDAHIEQERNAMNLVDYRNQMHEIIQQNTYLLREETVVQTQLNIALDPDDPNPVQTIETVLNTNASS